MLACYISVVHTFSFGEAHMLYTQTPYLTTLTVLVLFAPVQSFIHGRTESYFANPIDRLHNQSVSYIWPFIDMSEPNAQKIIEIRSMTTPLTDERVFVILKKL